MQALDPTGFGETPSHNQSKRQLVGTASKLHLVSRGSNEQAHSWKTRHRQTKLCQISNRQHDLCVPAGAKETLPPLQIWKHIILREISSLRHWLLSVTVPMLHDFNWIFTLYFNIWQCKVFLFFLFLCTPLSLSVSSFGKNFQSIFACFISPYLFQNHYVKYIPYETWF